MGKIDDLEKLQELRSKGILTQEEFEQEKKKVLNETDSNINISNSEIENIYSQAISNEDEHISTEQNIKNRKLYIIISIIAIIIIVGVILFIINNNKKEPVNETDSNIIDTNSNDEIENTGTDEEQLITYLNLKYNLKDNNEVDSYILFENNQFEICIYKEDTKFYMWGNYLQYIEEITFNVTSGAISVEYEGQNIETATAIENQETLTGILSNNGKVITLLSEDEENLVFELSNQEGTIQKIIAQENIENSEKPTSPETSNSSNSTNIQKPNTNSTTNVSQSNNEMIQVPYFSLGNELEYYTKELANLGITYNVVKGQNLDYKDNTVIKVEHNGERIEKGTTITITVADNIYDMDVMVSTGYLLDLADLGYDYEKVKLSIKINGTNICNGVFERTDTQTEMPITVGKYRGKPDNLTLDITIEGKKITKSINYRYVEAYQGIVIYKGGSIGPQG